MENLSSDIVNGDIFKNSPRRFGVFFHLKSDAINEKMIGDKSQAAAPESSLEAFKGQTGLKNLRPSLFTDPVQKQTKIKPGVDLFRSQLLHHLFGFTFHRMRLSGQKFFQLSRFFIR